MIRVRHRDTRAAAPGYVRHTAEFTAGEDLADLWFMVPDDTRPLTDDWLLLPAVLMGMIRGQDVHVVGRVGARLLDAMDRIQRITVERHAGLTRVQVTADEILASRPTRAPWTLACFSAGVDAFFTVLELEPEIDELLYVHGLEALVDDDRQLAMLLPQVKAAAQELRKPLRLVETNWREVFEPLVGHGYFVSVPALATIAHLMSSRVSRLLVPATHDPFHALEDPLSVSTLVGLWATGDVEMMEHGVVPRLQKVQLLTGSDVAMRRLRVCWARDGWTYNCGRCGKCMRTRVHLALLGAEGRCGTLPERLDLGTLRRTRPERAINLAYLDDNIAEAEARGLPDLAEALRIQRRQDARPPTLLGAPRAKLERIGRKLRKELVKRRLDRTLAKLRRHQEGEHLFNLLESAPVRGDGD